MVMIFTVGITCQLVLIQVLPSADWIAIAKIRNFLGVVQCLINQKVKKGLGRHVYLSRCPFLAQRI